MRASARFALDSEQLASALGRLQASLSQLGDVCGSDDQGHQFASGYNPKAAMVQEAVQSLVKGLAGIEQGLQVMALNYADSDAASQVRGGG